MLHAGTPLLASSGTGDPTPGGGGHPAGKAEPAVGWLLLAACGTAGALAMPLHVVATPVAAAIAVLAGRSGERLFRWSRLPDPAPVGERPGLARLARASVSLAVGTGLGLLVLAALRLAIEPAVPAVGARLAAAGALPLWHRLVVAYVAAVGEEVAFRLILLSAIAGVLARLIRSPGRRPGPAVVGAAVGLSALTFAAGHLPAWSSSASLGPGLVFAVLALDSAGGLVFGWVFVRWGIGAAILAHAGADAALQLLGPLTR